MVTTMHKNLFKKEQRFLLPRITRHQSRHRYTITNSQSMEQKVAKKKPEIHHKLLQDPKIRCIIKDAHNALAPIASKLKFFIPKRNLGSLFFLFVEHKVLILLHRPKHIEHDNIKRETSSLLGEITNPLVFVSGNGLQRKDHNAGEIQVPNDNNVELPEEGQLGQVPGCLPVGLGGLPERPDGPHNRENDGAAADNVNKQEDLVPSNPILDEGTGFADDDGGNVGEDLERDDDHEDLLLALLEEGFEEGPASADQDDDGEEEDDADELEDVEEDVPAVRGAGDLYVVLVLGGAEEVEGLHEEERRHEEVDPVE
ncbi:hypothetical protein GmHk_13G037520 [Glycine max]|nr:hypothetical protein GmHk_13G037520 [Glycine max]